MNDFFPMNSKLRIPSKGKFLTKDKPYRRHAYCYPHEIEKYKERFAKLDMKLESKANAVIDKGQKGLKLVFVGYN